MATVGFGTGMVSTIGELPAVGTEAPDALLVSTGMEPVNLSSIPGRRVLNIFPSIGTGVCQASVRSFNERAAQFENTSIMNISMDLPFALNGFCAAEGIEGVQSFSAFRGSFAQDYGVEFTEGKFAGLCSRSIVIIDENNQVVYTEQVPSTGQEPDYDAALAAIKAL